MKLLLSENTVKLDISDLPAGLYFIQLADAQGTVQATKKFTRL